MILVHSRDCEQLLWNQSWLPLLRLYFLFSCAFRATSPCTLRSTQRPQNHKQLCPVWSLLHWGSARSLHVKPGMRWSPRDKADPQPSHSGGWCPLPLLAHHPQGCRASPAPQDLWSSLPLLCFYALTHPRHFCLVLVCQHQWPLFFTLLEFYLLCPLVLRTPHSLDDK